MKNIAESISRGLILAGLSTFIAGYSQAEVESPKIEAKKLELKAGDKMPQFFKENIFGGSNWHDGFSLKHGFIEYHQDANSRKDVAYIVCKDKNIIFGFYDFEIDTLYLDNNPADGIIDSVVKNPNGRKISKDAPRCPKELL